jgi:site-specific DNA recombinase
MASDLNPPLVAKRDHRLRVLFVERVSSPGPGKQDIRSLDDQEAMLREWLKTRTDLPFEATIVAGSGSGEHLDRKEFLELTALVETSRYDAVICEDVGRVVRRLHAHLFAECCVDHDTRLIAINDYIDTAVDGWQDRSIFSAWHHERSNKDTSERIKRTHRSRFAQGGTLSRLMPGYIKPPGAKSDAEICKDSYWEPIYDEWFTRLENGATFSMIADWLNSIGAPTGCKRGKQKAKDKYDCQLVAQRTRNQLLKGQRVRNERISKRVNSSGHRRSVKAPPELRLERSCPHLAFIEPERYDRVLALIDHRNGKFGPKGEDSRKNRPKRRTRAMGQQCFCSICGRLYVFGGHGQRTHLMCDGARQYRCWQGATINGPLAAAKILEAVVREIEALDDFDEAFRTILDEEARRVNNSLDAASSGLNHKLANTQREVGNILAEIRNGTRSQLLGAELCRLESELARLKSTKAENERRRVGKIEVPPVTEIKQRFRETLQSLSVDSLDFAHGLRRLIPRILVRPVRLCDGGQIVLRATFRLQLSNLVDDVETRGVLKQPLERVLTVDLFDRPQRELFRSTIVALRKLGVSECEAARRCGITVTAAQKAAALQRTMDQLEIDDPYEDVTVPPEERRKLRRHRHPRYFFEPLDDAGRV